MMSYKPTHEFEVWPDPREDDGVAEGEDEHGDVDDVEWSDPASLIRDVIVEMPHLATQKSWNR